MNSGDDRSRQLDGVRRFLSIGVVVRMYWVLQLIAPTQRTKVAESLAELRSCCQLDGVVATLRRRPQALVRQQRSKGLTRGVVGEDKGRVRVGVQGRSRCFHGYRCLREKSLAACRLACELLQLADRDQCLNLGLSKLPLAIRRSPFRGHQARRYARMP